MKPLTEIVAMVKDHPKLRHLDVAEEGIRFIIGKLTIVCSSGDGWDHVSVSTPIRTPRYQEMKAIKRLCFKPDEWAYELHPPASDYISIHPYVLHMWRKQETDVAVPPKEMV